MAYRRAIVALSLLLNSLLVGVILAQCVACSQIPRGTPAFSVSDPAVVRLILTTGFGSVNNCTAWKVSDRFAMTAGHCCDKVYDLMAADGTHSVPGVSFVVRLDDDVNDVCILEGPIKGPAIPLALRDAAIGERVWTVGFPRGIYLISEGFWSGRNEQDREYGIASTVVWGGASGSPLLNTQGVAVAMITNAYPTFDNMTITATIEWMRTDLMRAERLP